jgi:hypothetical protein
MWSSKLKETLRNSIAGVCRSVFVFIAGDLCNAYAVIEEHQTQSRYGVISGEFELKLGNTAHFNAPTLCNSGNSTGTCRAIFFSVNFRLKGGQFQ